MREVILEELKKIEAEEQVKIILAVESGSRAWGFASEDSDYDVRFIYVRKKEDYLKLNPPRDVIEWKLDDVLDINGWDLKKALGLLHKCNPSIFEWCTSSIVYLETEAFRQLKELLPFYFSPKKSMYHYWHMAENNRRAYLQKDEVNVKKYLYVFRPLLAAKYIYENHTYPPMEYEKLVETQLEDGLKAEMRKLVDRKKQMCEPATVPRIDLFHEYIDAQLPLLKAQADEIIDIQTEWEPLNAFFLSMVQEQYDHECVISDRRF